MKISQEVKCLNVEWHVVFIKYLEVKSIHSLQIPIINVPLVAYFQRYAP